MKPHPQKHFFNCCWEVWGESIVQLHWGSTRTPGKTVEMDESKFGKTKYHRDCRIKEVGVCGICGETKACFLVPVERRNKDTDLPKMNNLWRAYMYDDCPNDKSYCHLTVDHTLNFLNQVIYTCPHTWWGVKPQRGMSKDLFERYLQWCGLCSRERIPSQHNQMRPRGSINAPCTKCKGPIQKKDMLVEEEVLCLLSVLPNYGASSGI